MRAWSIAGLLLLAMCASALAQATVSGTVSCSAWTGGTIRVEVRQAVRGNLLASCELEAPGSYSLEVTATPSTPVVVTAWWDADASGGLSPGDRWGSRGPVRLQEGDNAVDVEAAHRVTALLRGALDCPEGGGLVHVRLWDGPDRWSAVLLSDFLVVSSEGQYEAAVLDVPLGSEVWVGAWWDADADGRLSGGDWLGSCADSPLSLQEQLEGLDLELNPYLPGDLDGDGDVDGSDLAAFAPAYASGEQRADLNLDGEVDLEDLRAMAGSLGARLVLPLRAQAQALPAFGAAPLRVQLAAAVSGGVPPYAFSWDLNGDGQEDDDRQSFVHVFSEVGDHPVRLVVTDQEGRTAEDEVTVRVRFGPRVTAQATPSSGQPPLEVNLSCQAYDPDGQVVLYEWDFEGDGTYDWSSPEGCCVGHAYDAKGSYRATVRVTDDDGLTATASVTVCVGDPPEVTPSADVLTGIAPLTVSFGGTASDPDGQVVLYEWDFEGDGTYDWSSPESPQATFTYQQGGVYRATLRVTDDDGISTTRSLLISVAGAPVALPRAYPLRGQAPLTVTFFTDGMDLDGSPVRFEWDFDGDGTYEWSMDHSTNAIHTYEQPGVYHATLRVTDDDGLTATASLDIEVVAPPAGPSARAIAFPRNGGAPLRVWLLAQATDPNGDIVLYEWDFDGDGTYEWQERVRPPSLLGSPLQVEVDADPAAGDLDGDGDPDLILGDEEGGLWMFRNEGRPAAPRWSEAIPVCDAGGQPIDVGYHASPALADLDGDGDLDLIVGEYYGQLYLWRNDGTPRQPSWTEVGPLLDANGEPVSVDYAARPALADLDGDGDLDLIVGEYYGQLYLWRNDGTPRQPSFVPQGSLSCAGQPIDVGSHASPALADLDGDGDVDLLVGDHNGYLHLYRRDGGRWIYRGRLTDLSGSLLDAGYYAKPIVLDLDGDGDPDLLVGNGDGRVCLFGNVGTAQSPRWWPWSDRYARVAVDYHAAPAAGDVDGDGRADLLLGCAAGRVLCFHNAGDGALFPLGAMPDSAGQPIDVGSHASPALADLDGDGDPDLLVGSADGKVYLWSNQEEGWSGGAELVDASGQPIQVASNACPALADLDGDGDPDLLVGSADGKVYLWSNQGGVWSPEGVALDSGGSPVEAGEDAAPALLDLDGDGDPDLLVGEAYGAVYLFPRAGGVAHIYEEPGVYHATLRVTDQSGLTATDSVTIDVGPAGSPWATAWAEPTEGTGPLQVTFHVRAGDPDGQVVLYEWDFDGDGTYEWSSQESGEVAHAYTAVGVFRPTLRVTDEQGHAVTCSLEVRVTPRVTWSSAGGFNPHAGEQGAVTFELNADATVTLKVVTEGGQAVRTLLEGASLPAGSHTLSWDGRNETGQLVPDGIYYFVLECEVDGQTYTFDPREGFDFPRVAPPRSFPASFAPLEDQFFTITYSLDLPAEVSVFIWTWGEDGWSMERVRTLLVRDFRPPGSHTEIWDGTDDRGRLPPADQQYAVTIWAWELPEGAMVVYGSKPEISDVSADPNYFSPAYNPYAVQSTAQTVISFRLSRKADVQMMVTNEAGALVHQEYHRELPAGINQLVWDGRDMEGRLVARGIYRITLRAVDPQGHSSTAYGALVKVFY